MAAKSMNHRPDLESWLAEAASGLTARAAERVRDEMLSHYECARDEALDRGAAFEEAHEQAIAALGDAKVSNREYRKVHPTTAELNLLRGDDCVGRVIRSRPYLLLIPAVALCAALIAHVLGLTEKSLVLLVGTAGICFVFGAPYLISINTKARGIAYRSVRLAWMTAIVWMAMAPSGDRPLAPALTVFFPILAAVAWLEWKRLMMRKKLPAHEWPKSLYL